MEIRLVVQPEGSSLCGQACVAMAAGVTLALAVDAIGHEKARGTHTDELVKALGKLGVGSATKLKRVSRSQPVLPKRAIICIQRPKVEGERRYMGHWMLHWDGKVYDPANRWPEAYKNWKITSVLEIYE